jgi:hypothetical protein
VSRSAALLRVGSVHFLFGGDGPTVRREVNGCALLGDMSVNPPVGRTRLAERAKAEQRQEQRLQSSQKGGWRSQRDVPLCRR